jgi:hypothetical protein
MDITNKTSFSSLDSKIITPEQSQQIKTDQQSSKIVDLSLSIDDKFTDNLSVKKSQILEATVIKNENGIQTLKLDNGKEIEVKLPIDLKVLDKLSLQVENSQIKQIQVKDLVQNINISKQDIALIIKSLQLNTAVSNLDNNLLDLDLSSLNLNDNTIKAKLLNLISLNVNLNKSGSDFLKILEGLKANLANPQASLDLQSLNVQTTTENKIATTTPVVNNIEFKDAALKVLLNAIVKSSNNNSNEFDLKVIKQENSNSVQTSLNDNIKLNLNLSKPEDILAKFITLKASDNTNQAISNKVNINDSTVLKTSSNNTVESIKITPETFKNLLEPIKAELKQIVTNNQQALTNTDKANNAIVNNLNANTLKTEFSGLIQNNKISIPSLDNLTIKLPFDTKQLINNNLTNKTDLNNQSQALANINNQIKADATPAKLVIEENPVTKQPEILVKTQTTTIKLENIDLELNSKLVNHSLESLLQQSTVSQVNSNKILLKSPSMFEILLSVKNSITDTNQVKFTLNDSNNLVLKTPGNLQTTNQEVNLKNEINKQAIPHLGKQFAAQLAIMIASTTAIQQSSKQADKDSDIFSLLLDSIPDSYKPQLQASSNNADSLKYFTFPYYKEDDVLDHGQLTYQSHTNDEGDDVHNVALKVEFSNIGEVMLKIKNINKEININIYTKRELNTTNKLIIQNITQQAIEKSGFLGTVSIKKSESMQMPLLNTKKIVYSGINLEV